MSEDSFLIPSMHPKEVNDTSDLCHRFEFYLFILNVLFVLFAIDIGSFCVQQLVAKSNTDCNLSLLKLLLHAARQLQEIMYCRLQKMFTLCCVNCFKYVCRVNIEKLQYKQRI